MRMILILALALAAMGFAISQGYATPMEGAVILAVLVAIWLLVRAVLQRV